MNFGNSGGAAFDQFGGYIGIPTLKDQAGNSFILEYAQIHDWVQERSDRKPRPNQAAYDYYQSLMNPQTTTQAATSEICSSRCQYFKALALKRSNASSTSVRNSTSRDYSSIYSSRYR